HLLLLFLSFSVPPRDLHSFPTRRSSDLFLTAAARPDLVDRLVMLEGHAAGSDDEEDAARLGRFFASWPVPFADVATARSYLGARSEEHTSELQSRFDLVCRLLLEKKKAH